MLEASVMKLQDGFGALASRWAGETSSDAGRARPDKIESIDVRRDGPTCGLERAAPVPDGRLDLPRIASRSRLSVERLPVQRLSIERLSIERLSIERLSIERLSVERLSVERLV